MKSLLVALNAKYIHTNLALLSLRVYAKSKGFIIDLLEATINWQNEVIVQEIYKQKPDVLGFSCYIWNMDKIKSIAATLKKLLPNCLIFLGGPEVSFNPDEILKEGYCHTVLIGEGEQSLVTLLSQATVACENHTAIDFSKILGCCYNSDDGAVTTPPPAPLCLDNIPFPYSPYSDLSAFENRIIYYESSRGCPFSCQYCLSGERAINGGTRVRNLSLDRVFSDLQFFLDNNVVRVKFVDRTFNCEKQRAMAVWRYLSEHDNGVTNFHFELAAELLDEEQIAFLNTVRKGLFQFEIGVQSTNLKTLEAIKRITLPDILTPVINGLQSGGNIHLHLDLIAGLPYEDIAAFKDSFNYVYSLLPNQLQLGFLKLLKGSGLYDSAKSYGIVCSAEPPYEVLFTDALSYDDLLSLKMLEIVLEKYYNSGRFKKSVDFLLGFFNSPFELYTALGSYYEQKGYHLTLHNKNEDFTILFEFLSSLCNDAKKIERFKFLALFDCFENEKLRQLPKFLDNSTFARNRNRISAFFENQEKREKYLPEYSEFDPVQLMRMMHIEIFPFNPNKPGYPPEKTAVLFGYRGTEPQAIEL